MNTLPNSSRFPFHERIGFVLLLMLLAWSPIPYGSNRPWAEAFFETLIFGLLAMLLLAELWSSGPRPAKLANMRSVLCLLFIWVAWICAQIVPVPAVLVQYLSATAYAIQLPVLSAGEWMSISVDRDATLAIALRVSAVTALVSLLVLLLNSRRRLLIFALVLVVCGLLEAIAGLGIYWSGAADVAVHIGSRDPIGPVGTYISRNHFAGFLEMALAMNTGLLLEAFRPESSGSGWRGWLRDISAQLLSLRALLLTAQLVMFAALILSGSRGGVLALMIAAVIVGGGLALRKGVRAMRSWLPILLAAVGALWWFGGGAFLNRISSLGLSSNRLDLAQVSLRIIADYPFTGSGAGTFRWVFPLYKDLRFGGLFYEHAHNDYLEIASEQGLIGLALFLSLVGLMLYRIYRVYSERHDRLVRGVSLGALIAGVSLLGHSMIDFNLQIPANFYWFFAILTAGVCAGRVKHGGYKQAHETI